MDLQVYFAQENMWSPVTLDFTKGEDGLPRTRGYAQWQGERLDLAQSAL